MLYMCTDPAWDSEGHKDLLRTQLPHTRFKSHALQERGGECPLTVIHLDYRINQKYWKNICLENNWCPILLKAIVLNSSFRKYFHLHIIFISVNAYNADTDFWSKNLSSLGWPQHYWILWSNACPFCRPEKWNDLLVRFIQNIWLPSFL